MCLALRVLLVSWLVPYPILLSLNMLLFSPQLSNIPLSHPLHSAFFSGEPEVEFILIIFIFSCSRHNVSLFHRRSSGVIQQLQAPVLDPHEALLAEKFGLLTNEGPDPLELLYDFNLRSLSLIAAHRTASRLSDLHAASLGLIITELSSFCSSDFLTVKTVSQQLSSASNVPLSLYPSHPLLIHWNAQSAPASILLKWHPLSPIVHVTVSFLSSPVPFTHWSLLKLNDSKLAPHPLQHPPSAERL